MAALLAAGGAMTSMTHGQVLETYGRTLTAYSADSETLVGKVWPRDLQRGVNWVQMSQAEIVFSTGPSASDDVVYIVYGADRCLEFQRTGPTSEVFKGKNGAAGLVKHTAGALNNPADLYPEQTAMQAEADRRVSFAYNAQGQEFWRKDQAANEFETVYDTLGRATIKKFTSINTAAGFDDAVKRIETAYLSRGLVDTVTQYDATSGGAALDQVQYTYDGWSPPNITKFEQDPDGVIGAGGRAAFSVQYALGKNAPSAGRQAVRRSTITLPGSLTLTYGYGTANGTNDRLVATYRDSDSDPKERFLYHAAGLDGRGGSSYIDAVVFRDRDDTNGWNGAADGTLEHRLYFCQNWRQDVAVTVDSSGRIGEWIKYRAYGMPFGLPQGDTDSDGDFDSTDEDTIKKWTGGSGYDARADIDLDGDIDAGDFSAIPGSLSGQKLGWGVMSRSDVENRKGYASYEGDGNLCDPTFVNSNCRMWHVRYRVLDSLLGRWMTRDLIPSALGSSLYLYCDIAPVSAVDAHGLLTDRIGTFGASIYGNCTSCSTPASLSSPPADAILYGAVQVEIWGKLDPEQCARSDPAFRRALDKVRSKCRGLSISWCPQSTDVVKTPCTSRSTCGATSCNGGRPTICICGDYRAGDGVIARAACGRPMCEILRHELNHAFQCCTSFPTIPTPPRRDGTYPPIVEAICREIGAWANNPGAPCFSDRNNKKTFCKCMCSNAFSGNAECPGLCEELFTSCKSWAP